MLPPFFDIIGTIGGTTNGKSKYRIIKNDGS